MRIGDWMGAAADIDDFFADVCQLVEVCLAVGSLLYRDRSVCIFSFPGERADGSGPGLQPEQWQDWLGDKFDGFAQDRGLETPPYCHISEPTRSLVPIVKEMREARDRLTVPVHKAWSIANAGASGHVCPVCLMRRNGRASDKQHPCEVCRKRRRGRLDAWLGDKLEFDTIWLNELADRKDRVALNSLSLDLDHWLDGTRLDALRAQTVSEWRTFNPTLQSAPNPIGVTQPFADLIAYVGGKYGSYDKQDRVLRSLQDGYQYEDKWQTFFTKIVEDRSDAPTWDNLTDEQRARWLVHQLFRKLPSPGRTYRFWRQAEEFFNGLLGEFREIAARDANRWRVRRVVLPDQANSSGWQDREVYDGRVGDAPVSLLYRKDQHAFVTICNLARLLRPEDGATALVGREMRLQGDDDRIQRTLRVQQVNESDLLATGALGAYYPLILLDLSPIRFRVMVPLKAASACLDRAIEAWNTQFARIWDRLPLRASMVAFPQKVPFQAVIEATRNLEANVQSGCGEVWRITARRASAGVVTLTAKRPDGGTELRTIPVDLPDGRTDVFHPYLAVADGATRFPRDFQHPNGQVYRHAQDLRSGDGIQVYPSRVATMFLDATGRRFDPVAPRPLAEWVRMREVWRVVERTAPSLTALHGAWSELVARMESWCCPEGHWLPSGRAAWRDLARSIYADRLEARGAVLEALVEAADDGTLDWALDWRLSVLKEQIAEVTRG